MKQKRPEKKNFVFKLQSRYLDKKSLSTLIYRAYDGVFRVYRKSRTRVAIEYLSGLLQCEKGHENMERMVEKVTNSDYKRYIHFLSGSKWSYQDANHITMKQADSLLREQKKKSGRPTGFIFDETSHLKKGNKSVAVARQYAGVVGKVDNCQISVHAFE